MKPLPLLPSTLLALVSASLSSGQPVYGDETYFETLEHHMLRDSKVLSRFSFNFASTFEQLYGVSSSSQTVIYHSRAFPRSIAAIIRSYGVGQMRLALSAGRWDYDTWGAPEHHGSEASPPGAELTAWLEHSFHWPGLTNALSGLFCTSLAQMHMRQSPSLTFAYSDASVQRLAHTHSLQYATLPLEHPCTENLTPFIAQLPCRNFAGLATLLDPHFLFDANYQAISVSVHTSPEEGTVDLKLNVEVVSDPVRTERRKGGKGRRNWSAQSLFGRKVEKLCPASESTKVALWMDQEQEDKVTLKPGKDWMGQRELGSDDLPWGLSTEWKGEDQFSYPSEYTPAPLRIERLNAGQGQERGQIGVRLLNDHDHPVHAVWTETLPWWIKLYLHTLTPSPTIKAMQYTPAVDRVSTTLLEANVELPPNSSTELWMDYDKAYLRYTEYPPDAHRGFSVPSAILSWAQDGREGRAYSTTSLLMAPLPDFSMPYNVIVLTCTVLALAFGTLFNLMERQFVAVDGKSGCSAASKTEGEAGSKKQSENTRKDRVEADGRVQ